MSLKSRCSNYFNIPMSQNYLKTSSLFKWVGIIFILSLIGLIAWWGAKKYLELQQPRYRTVPIEEGPMVASIRASGTLNPVRSVTVGTGVSGMIRELKVDFNDKVKQGQVIAKIDQREFQARYDQALANYELAEKNHQYNVELMQQGFISEQALVNTDNAKKAALGALDLTKKSLDDTLIRSPVDGVVVKRSVEVGQTVAASLQSPEIFIIARNLAEMQVETSIDESDVGRIEEGQEASFTVDAFPNRTFLGRVKQIRKAPVNIQNVVTYTVLISADNPDFKLLPGMTANARIVVDRKETALKVPSIALRFRMPTSNQPIVKDQKPSWWKFWETKQASQSEKTNKPSSSPEKNDLTNTSNAPSSPWSQRAGRSVANQSNYRSVYVLENNGTQDVPVRKSFRLGVTDGDYSEILPLKEGGKNQLKVGDLVITGIDGQTTKSAPSSPRNGPRMF